MGNKGRTLDLSHIKEWFTGKKGTSILMAAGLIGIALILLSSFWPSSAGKSSKSASSAITSAEYAAQLGNQLENIVGKIDGVGKVQVLVTVDSGVQYVYEQNQKSSNDKSATSQTDGSTQTQENNDTEQNPVIVDNASGGQSPLVRTELQPAVKGVVVVCDGGDNPTVKESVTDAIMTALDLPSTRISVSKRAGS